MAWSEERTKRVCARMGRAFLVVAAVTVVIGLLSGALLDVAGARIAASGVYYALGGLAFHPSTWEQLSYPFYPQRTPVIGILLVVAATGSLWTVVGPVLFG